MNGLDQIGAPTRTRSSTTSPTADATAVTTIAAENSTSGRCHDRHGGEGHRDGANHERAGDDDGSDEGGNDAGGSDDGTGADMSPPPCMDSGTIRYLIAPLSMMEAWSARAGTAHRAKVRE
ncbi:hypothetical protein GCM10027072_40860 [Streptomyces bullii]